jgi:O-antigen ligase
MADGTASATLHLGPQRAASLRQVAMLPLVHVAARILFALFIFFTCFTFLRPSPYDFAALPAMAIWLALGIRLHRSAVPFAALLILFTLSLVIALIPYLGEEDPTAWTLQSIYLSITGVFFTMFFSDDTQSRVELALKAYLASCLFAAVCGTIAYFGDTGILFTMDGRAAGVFEDPNVLGSFLILGLLYCLRDLLTGESRHPFLSLIAMAVLLTGIFLSFSRGSWGATMLSVILVVGMTSITSSRRVRARIRVFTLVALGASALVLAGLFTVPGISERFTDRAQLTKDYDQGETGRFGNQLRSIPMLIERPGGFGPLRFRLTFGLEPHNSYIGGFANGGWFGGLTFLGLVLVTVFVGFRLCLVQSPYLRLAQIAFPALLMFFLQALQIDIDHWRHVYLLLGMVWGLEAARLKWAAGRRCDAAEAAELRRT